MLVRKDVEYLKCREAALLVKVWASRRGLIGAQHGFPAPCCWVSLTLYAFRAYWQAREPMPPKFLTLSMGLRLVFEGVLGVEQQQPCEVDPLFGVLARRQKDSPGAEPVLFVQDIGFPSRNMARSVRRSQWRTCVNEAKR